MESARKYIAERTPQQLSQMTRDDIIKIANSLTKPEFKTFLFEKNIKLFGGINPYVEDFLKKINTGVPNDVIVEFISMLNTMKAYPGLSEENKLKVNNRIEVLKMLTGAAAAAGGSSKKKRKTRRKGLKRKDIRK
jgi:hypothetical protein